MKYFPKWLQFITVMILVGPVVGGINYLDKNFGISSSFTGIFLIISILSFYLWLFIKEINKKTKKNFQMNYLKYKREDYNRVFSLIQKLKKNKKPNFFSSALYKQLYRSSSKNFLIQKHDEYFQLLPSNSELESAKLANELVFLTYNYWKIDMLKEINSPF